MAFGSNLCKVCRKAALQEIDGFEFLPRVTSDCIPFRAGGRLLICCHCHAVQSPVDDQWFEEIREIYGNYYAYHQAGGVEQAVRDASSGQLLRRSDLLLSRLDSIFGIPKAGKILDIGCGTGATLRAFSDRGGWCLYGSEIDEKNLPILEQIKGFESLYTCAPADVPGQFNLVTMVHALEHFPDPLATIRDLQSKITDGGYLFIEVPNAEANPFDYVIADHMMHFTAATLTWLVSNAGFEINCCSTTWIPKELSMTARPGRDGATFIDGAPPAQAINDVHGQIDWLRSFVTAASQAMDTSSNFGLFGTSIAATWLCGILGDKVSFFVEEDVNRIGRSHMGRPVIGPDQIESGSVVFMALTPQLANQIASRLPNDSIEIVLPPCRDAQHA